MNGKDAQLNVQQPMNSVSLEEKKYQEKNNNDREKRVLC